MSIQTGVGWREGEEVMWTFSSDRVCFSVKQDARPIVQSKDERYLRQKEGKQNCLFS